MKEEEQTTTTTITKSRGKKVFNYAKSIKAYLNQEAEFVQELAELQYSIKVSKNHMGRWKAIAGRRFENLESLPDDLGEHYGSGKYRFFITGVDDKGERRVFMTITDFEIEWDGGGESRTVDDDDGIDDEAVQESADSIETERLKLQIRKMELDSAERIEQMKLQQATVQAMAQMKGGGGGIGLRDMLSTLRQGISIGQGQPLLEPGESAGGDGMDIAALLNNPLVQNILGSLIQRASQPSQVSGPVVVPAKEPGA